MNSRVWRVHVKTGGKIKVGTMLCDFPIDHEEDLLIAISQFGSTRVIKICHI